MSYLRRVQVWNCVSAFTVWRTSNLFFFFTSIKCINFYLSEQKLGRQFWTYRSQRCRIAAVGALGGSYIPPQLPPCLHQAKGAPRAPDTHSAPGTWPWWLWPLHHSINTRQPLLILFHSKANQAGSQQRGDGWEVEAVRRSLLSWKAAVDRNVFISLKCTSEFRAGANNFWVGRMAAHSLAPSLSLSLSPPHLPPSLQTTHRETYNSWIQSHSGLECWEGRTQGASYVLNNLRTASSNAKRKKKNIILCLLLYPLLMSSLFSHWLPLSAFMQLIMKAMTD